VLLARTDAEFGTAATIDPDAALVPSPGLAFNARRAAALAYEAHATDLAVVVCAAILASAIVRGAIDDVLLVALTGPVASSVIAVSGLEVGAASAIDPNAIARISPSSAFDARRPGNLAGQLDSATSVNTAELTAFVVGSAVNRLPTSTTALSGPVTSAATTKLEVGATSTVNPDPVPVVAPGLSLNAGRSGDLPHEPDTPASVGIAVLPTFVIGGATNGLSTVVAATAEDWTSAQIAARLGAELGTATLIDPKIVIVESPRAAFDARRAADLANQCDAAGAAGDLTLFQVLIVRFALEGYVLLGLALD